MRLHLVSSSIWTCLALVACGDDSGTTDAGDTGNGDDSSTSSPADDSGTAPTDPTAADDDGDDSGTTVLTNVTSETASTDTSADEASGDDSSGTTGTAACGAEIEPTQWPTSGFYIHFVAAEEHAHVWIDNAASIAYVDSWLIKPDVPLGIPGGPIELESEFNPGYEYRLVPSEVTFGEVWTEVCDAAPCYIEDDPAAWLANPGDWCPWAFEPVEIWDCRDGDGTSCALAYP
jgi:hypothetical protein